MAQDTGVVLGKKDAGRWVIDHKSGRKRNLFIYMADHGRAEDQSYIGYYHDEANADTGCSLSVAIGEKEVNLQFVNPKTKAVVIKSVETSKFMDVLDGILDLLS